MPRVGNGPRHGEPCHRCNGFVGIAHEKHCMYRAVKRVKRPIGYWAKNEDGTLTTEAVAFLQELVNGDANKVIGYKFGLEEHQVSKRIEYFREFFKAKSKHHLVAVIMRMGVVK